jgi:hypothetical protein
MKLHTLSFLFYSLLLIASHVRAENAVDLIRDEDYLPFHTVMNRAIATEDGSLSIGERVVVLRPMTATSLRVDVPRKGVFTVPFDATDVEAEIDRAKQLTAEGTPLVPRMALFLTNRMISGESGWQNTLPVEHVHAFKRWILLYGDAQTEATHSVVSMASEYYQSLPQQERARTAFLYMDVEGNKAAIQQMAEALEPSIQCMPGYLSKGYARSLDQMEVRGVLPQLIEVAPSGRILDQVVGVQAVSHWLKAH